MKLYDELVWRGLIKDITSPSLEKRLNEGGMTFYIGTDPTADSMHLGHLSSFLISARLKRGGHNPILLVGGATGLIGDPRPSSERNMITKEEVEHNYQCLKTQAEKIFGFQVVNNYDWSKEINFIDYLRDYGKYFSINYMLDKDIIRRRLDSGITYTEFSYMIMQALDFLYLYENNNCELQVAGSDQWGNITAGVDLIKKKIGKEAYGFTMPLVTTKDGTKFGKSEGNALWLDKNKTSSYELYQFLINVEDEMVISYLKIFTFLSKEEIDALEVKLNKQPELREPHKVLAHEIITFLHGEEEYDNAVRISEALFNGNISSLSVEEILVGFKDVPNFKIDEELNIVDFLVNNNICTSKREARELINSNSIYINDEKVEEDLIVTKKIAIGNRIIVLRKGKKKYFIGEF